jgi:hypothetical protein
MRRLLILALLAAPALAQQSPSPVRAQHEAIAKLSFLEGNWSGSATINEGPNTPLHITQTERVEPKLDGLILTVEGAGIGPSGRIVFRAFATISYDDAAHQYRIRAYNEGHYIDTVLNVDTDGDGFSWGYSAGQVHITNTMHLTGGEWDEKTTSTAGQNPPLTIVDMLLKHRQ